MKRLLSKLMKAFIYPPKKAGKIMFGVTTVVGRQFFYNADFLAILAVAIVFTFIGYSVASINLGLEWEEIQKNVNGFIETLAALLIGIASIIWKLTSQKGKLSEWLSAQLEEIFYDLKKRWGQFKDTLKGTPEAPETPKNLFGMTVVKTKNSEE